MRVVEYPRWIRGRLGGETVVDSKRARLIYLDGRSIPAYAFPEEDVRVDAVPPDAIARHDDLIQVDFGALDEWLEEEQRQGGDPPGPLQRIHARAPPPHRRRSGTRRIPSSASTPGPPRGTCACRSAAGSWPRPGAPRRCSRPASPRAGTSPVRTCSRSWSRAPTARCAPTRASRSISTWPARE